MVQSKSSKRWLNEHFKDVYVKRAQQEGFRARSAYKLMEINKKHHLIKPGMTVIDLGAAPGSWSEVVLPLVGSTGKVIAADILSIKPIANIKFIQGDFSKCEIQNSILENLGGNLVDVVLSDMAPNTSGIKEIDNELSVNLAKSALAFATKVLKPNGVLLTKVFQGKEMQEMVKSVQINFRQVKILRPDASRTRSKEVYLLAKGFILPNKKFLH